MIEHKDIESKNFVPYDNLILVHPRELPKGELSEGNIILEMEQNTSIVDRPTVGQVLSVGKDFDGDIVDEYIIWVEQDGIDLILKDGHFLMLQEKSILGFVKNIKT